MIIINDNEGLGKPKWMKQIRMRNVSLKNAVKVGKFAIPIATSIIPGGGAVTKILDSKVGRSIGKIAKSKLVKKAVKLSKTKAGKMVLGQVKRGIQSNVSMTPMTAQKVASNEFDSSQPMEAGSPVVENQVGSTSQAEKVVNEPVGELTPVKPVETAQKEITPVEPKPKDNTMMYVGLGVLAIGGLYMATKKD